jgi:NAD(P)H-flavin reductase
MLRRDLHSVVASEPVGPYTLLRVERGDLEPGMPGQFFMLEAPGRVLPRPMSLSLSPPGELGFLFEAIGPGTNALAELEPGDRIGILGPLGNGFRLDVDRPLLVGGGIGVAPFPYLSQTLDRPNAILGFRSSHHAEAAELVPNAEVVVEPTRVTELLEPGYDVLACGPAPMLSAVRELAPGAQLAWEAPMACGYGACYGCVVEIGGHYKRLCLEGPVLAA